jgi:enamine deaminase RidA (YjgF/YER057c/UK114 family)
MTTALERLRQLGYELPQARLPVASYVPVTRLGNMLFVSGQLSTSENGVVTGRLGDTMNVVQGANAAELAALNVLAQVVHNGGIDLESIRKVLKLTVFVSATPDFTEHHLVANGASNLIAGTLGEAGKHARAAFGVAGLPLGAAIEVEAILEV